MGLLVKIIMWGTTNKKNLKSQEIINDDERFCFKQEDILHLF